MRDDDTFLAAAAGGLPQQVGADAVGTIASPNKGVLNSSNIVADDANLSVDHRVIPSSVAAPTVVEELVVVNKVDGVVNDDPADADQPAVNEPAVDVCAGYSKAVLTEGQQDVYAVPDRHAEEDDADVPSGGTCSSRQFIGKDK